MPGKVSFMNFTVNYCRNTYHMVWFAQTKEGRSYVKVLLTVKVSNYLESHTPRAKRMKHKIRISCIGRDSQGSSSTTIKVRLIYSFEATFKSLLSSFNPLIYLKACITCLSLSLFLYIYLRDTVCN